MSEQHQLQLGLSPDVANFTVLCLQVEGEEVLGAVFVGWVDDIVLSGSPVGHKELDFLHTAHVFAIFILHVDLLMEDLVCQADDSPPENLPRHLVQLLAQLVEDARASLTVECASVVVGDDNLLLALELPSVELVELGIAIFLSRALLAYS